MKKLLWVFLLASASAYPAPEKPKPPVVFTNTVRSAELYDLLTYPARLNPKINATILADSDGIVKEIITPLGRPVRRNQKILIMTHTDPVYDYAPITVIAPVHGVVSSVEVTEGSRVMRGAKLATITDPTKIVPLGGKHGDSVLPRRPAAQDARERRVGFCGKLQRLAEDVVCDTGTEIDEGLLGDAAPRP